MEEHKNTTNFRDQGLKFLNDKEWISFKNCNEAFKSKTHMKRSFCNEYRLNAKNYHFNKKKSYKSLDFSENTMKETSPVYSPFSTEKSIDLVYQNAIPNSVSLYFQPIS